jgi:hypothetical protein
LTAVPLRLAEIRAAGAAVAIDSGVLRIRVPRGALTAGQRDWLAQHRAEIAALLAAPPHPVSPVTSLPEHPADAVPRVAPLQRPVIEDLHIAGSVGRLAGLSARLDYARPPHRWGDFTDALRERDWRARLAALREEQTTISSSSFDGGRDLAAGSVGDDPAAWLAWMKSRIAVWQARGRSSVEVSQIVWSEAEDGVPSPNPRSF